MTAESHATVEDTVESGGEGGGRERATGEKERDEGDTFWTTPKYHFSPLPSRAAEGPLDCFSPLRIGTPEAQIPFSAAREEWRALLLRTETESVEPSPSQLLDAAAPNAAREESFRGRPTPDVLPLFPSTPLPPHVPSSSSFSAHRSLGSAPSKASEAAPGGIPEWTHAESENKRIQDAGHLHGNYSRPPTTSTTTVHNRWTEVVGTEETPHEQEKDSVRDAHPFISEVDRILRTNDEELDKAFQLLYPLRESVPNVVHI